MKFRKINDTTVNCIITQDDLKKHGIDLDDLFDRKKNAVEFIKKIIMKAANTVNLNIKNDYTSMRISVLPDQSVSLTISQDPDQSQRIREQKDLSARAMTGSDAGSEKKRPAVAAAKEKMVSESGVYLFGFPSIKDAVPACRILAGAEGIRTSVYHIGSPEKYYLVIEKGEGSVKNYESAVVQLSEFGKMVTCSDKTLAYFKEHCYCVLRNRAAERIAELYS